MKLNHKTLGQGPALIILHGMFGTLDNWLSLAKILAEDYTIYLLDLRNHGRSPHSEDFSYDVMCRDLETFMDEQGISRAHLLGHSMGGKVVMQFALENGARVESLLVADMAPKAYVGNHQPIFEALLGLDLSQVKERGEVQTYLSEKLEEPAVWQFLLKNLYLKNNGQYAWRMNVPVIYRAYQEILGQNLSWGQSYLGPTLFLAGGKSNYVLAHEFSSYASFFPKLSLKFIPQAGHWLHAEAPQDFLAEVKGFLGSLR